MLRGVAVSRATIVVADGGIVVASLCGPVDRLRVWIADRRANGEAFPGERIVRLPRKRRRL
jgi:hypothetical protein